MVLGSKLDSAAWMGVGKGQGGPLLLRAAALASPAHLAPKPPLPG